MILKKENSRALVLPVVLILAAAMIATSLSGGLTGYQVSSVKPISANDNKVNFGPEHVISLNDGFGVPDTLNGLAVWRMKGIDWGQGVVTFTSGSNTRNVHLDLNDRDHFGYKGEFVVGGYVLDVRVNPDNYVFLSNNVNRDNEVRLGEIVVLPNTNACLAFPNTCTGDVKFVPDLMVLNSATSSQISLTRLYGGGTVSYTVSNGNAVIVSGGHSYLVSVNNGRVILDSSWSDEV